MTKKQEKQVVNRYIKTLDAEDLGGDLRDVAERLIGLDEQYTLEGYTNLSLNFQQHYEDLDIDLYGDRLETDDEFAQRMKVEKVIAKNKETKKKKEYEKFLELKKKYEP